MALSRVGLVGYNSVSNAQIQPNTIVPADIEDRGITAVKLAIPQSFPYSANVTGNASINRSLVVGYTDGAVPQANLEVKGNTYISGATTIGGAATLSSTADVTGKLTSSSQTPAFYGANVTGNVSVTRSLAVGYTDGRVPQANLDVKGNVYVSRHVSLPDNAKVRLGDDEDLQIYHDASHSYLVDSGTGNLKIAGSQIDLLGGSDAGETMATFTDDGSVDLYYDNSKKLETTTVGTTITGTLIATTSTVTTGGSTILDFGTNQNFVITLNDNITLANPSTEQVGQSGVIVFIQDVGGSNTLSLGTEYETAEGAGITLSTAGNALDVIPYFVSASGRIQLGAVQLAFS